MDAKIKFLDLKRAKASRVRLGPYAGLSYMLDRPEPKSPRLWGHLMNMILETSSFEQRCV